MPQVGKLIIFRKIKKILKNTEHFFVIKCGEVRLELFWFLTFSTNTENFDFDKGRSLNAVSIITI